MTNIISDVKSSYEDKLGEITKLRFEVRLSEAAAQDVTFFANTADNAKATNAAKAGQDYVALGLTQFTIKAGETSAFVDVDVMGDALKENNEVFDLILSTPVGAGFAKGATLTAVGTIVDDEKTITAAAANVIEGKSGDTAKLRFEVLLSEAAAQDVTFFAKTADNAKATNAAKAGQDYVALSNTEFTIKAGDTSAFVDVDVMGDALKENNEVFDLILSTPVGAGFAKGATLTAVGTIVDDEKTITAAAANVIEGKSGDTAQLRFEVRLSEAAAQDVTFFAKTADNAKATNAAKAGDDYVALSNTEFTIKAGDTSAFVDVDVMGDALKENNEVFDLVLSAPVGAGFAKGATLTAVGTIVDDEKTITAAAANVIEGKSGDTAQLRFEVRLSEAAAQDVTFFAKTADNAKATNAAKAGQDYVALSNTEFTIKAGDTSAFVDVDVMGDALKENNEVFDLILSTPVGAGFAKGATLTAVGTIVDDEKTITAAAANVIEGKSGDTAQLRFEVRLSEAAAQDVTFFAKTADNAKATNAAKAGDDYVALSNTEFTIKAGDTSAFVDVDVMGDALKENNEVFDLVLSAPVGAGFAKGATLTAVGTIVDDEKTITAAAANVIEGKSGDTAQLRFEVRLSEAAAQDVTFFAKTADNAKATNAAKAGQDYVALSNTEFTIKAGDTSAFVDVDVMGDALKENNEVFDLILSTPVGAGFAKGATLTAVGTIVDDEKTITAAAANVIEGKSGDTAQLRFEVRLSEAAAQDVTFFAKTADNAKATNAAKAGQDYVALSNTEFTIKAGDTSAFVDVDVMGDALKENNEVFDLILSTPVGAGFAKGATLTAVGTIVDDEKTITAAAANVIEGKSGDTAKLRFEVLLSEAAAQDVTFFAKTADNAKATNAAKAGDDYVALSNTEFTIKAGDTSAFVDVDVMGDALKENNEVFDLILSTPVGAGFAKGATLTAVGTIVDDEKTITAAAANVIEGKSGDTAQLRFEVRLSEAAAQDVTFFAKTADNAKATNAAKAGQDYVALSNTEFTIKAGDTSAFVDVDVMGDALKENNEVFDLILCTPVGAGFAKGATLTAVGTIVDDEKTITAAAANVIEGKSGDTAQLRFEVRLSEAAAQDVTFFAKTADNAKATNAAKAGQDYVALSNTEFTIKAGDTSAFVDVDVMGDALKENNEVFDLILSTPVGAGFAKGATLTAVGTIVDDEKTITAAAANVIEGKSGDTAQLRFEVRLSEAAAQDVTFFAKTADNAKATNAAKAGDDYVALSNTEFTIKAGDTSAFVDVDVMGDALKENNEVFDLVLSAPVGAGFAKGATLTAVGTIVDDEKTITAAAANVIEGKSGDTAQLRFEVRLSEAAAQDVTFFAKTADNAKATNAAKAGQDYVALSNTEFTIKAGDTSAFVDVDVMGDALKENNEVFDLILSTPVGAGFAKGATLTAVGTIVDDEKTITAAAANVIEGKSGDTAQLRFEVRLSEAAAQDVTFFAKTADNAKATNAAKAGQDYVALSNTEFTIKAGDTSAFVDVDVMGDALKENNEVFDLILSTPVGAGFAKGATLTAVGTIVDDEKTITAAAANVIEGKSGDTAQLRFEVRLSEAAAQDVTFFAKTADNAKATNAAKAGQDYVALSNTEFTIKAGDTSAFVDVDVMGDALKENNEVFDLVLSTPVGAGFAKGATLTAVGTIVDDEKTIYVTPLVLDLNGDGITTQSISAGTEFDLLAGGRKIHTGWVSGGDGLLVLDRNHDGVINDGSELFGEATRLSSGETAANGYIALSAMDSNGDDFITKADSEFSALRVWVDANADGVSEAGEIRTLDSLGIAKLDLAATTSSENDNGNILGLVSNYQTGDGAKHAMADVWLVADKNECANTPLAPASVAIDKLPTKVVGLVEAISVFMESSANTTGWTTLRGNNSPAGALYAEFSAVAANVEAIAVALKQFDANGNPLASTGAVQSVSTAISLTPAMLLNSQNNGILAVGN